MPGRDVGHAGEGVRVHATAVAVVEGEVALLQAQPVVKVTLEARREDLLDKIRGRFRIVTKV